MSRRARLRVRAGDPWGWSAHGRLGPYRPASGPENGQCDPGAGLADLAENLSSLDTGSRERTFERLQQGLGNRAVQRIASASTSLPSPSIRAASPFAIARSAPANARPRVQVGRATSISEEKAPGGVKRIHERGGAFVFGYTQAKTVGDPPAFRLGSSVASTDGWVAKVNLTKTSPPDCEVLYPEAGVHEKYEFTTEEGKKAHIYLDISKEWSETIKKGELEHVDDYQWAWKLTWATIAAVVNAMAAAKLPPKPTASEADDAAQERFMADLPDKLRPEDASYPSQMAKWDLDSDESVFLKLFKVSRQARDRSGWHSPDMSPDHHDKDGNRYDTLSKGSSKIGIHSPEDVLKAAYKKLP